MTAERINLTEADYPKLQEMAGGLGINKGQSKLLLITEITAAWKKAEGDISGPTEQGAGDVPGGDVSREALLERLAAAELRAEVAEATAGDSTPESLRTQLKDAEDRTRVAESRVAELKSGGAVVKDPTTPEEVERELRRWLKKDGGFKKDLPEADKDKCRRMLKKANAMLKKGDKPRTIEDGWNVSIKVDGFEQSLLNSPADKNAEAAKKIKEAAALLP